MNDVDYKIVNPDPAGTTASPSSLNVPAELDAERNLDVREPTVVPPVAIRAHHRRIGVATCRLAKKTLWHLGRITVRTCGADFLHAWTMTRDNRQLTYRVNRKHLIMRQMLRGGADSGAPARALVSMSEVTAAMAALRIMRGSGTVDDPEPVAEAAYGRLIEFARRIYGPLISQDEITGKARIRIRPLWLSENRLRAEA